MRGMRMREKIPHDEDRGWGRGGFGVTGMGSGEAPQSLLLLHSQSLTAATSDHVSHSLGIPTGMWGTGMGGNNPPQRGSRIEAGRVWGRGDRDPGGTPRPRPVLVTGLADRHILN